MLPHLDARAETNFVRVRLEGRCRMMDDPIDSTGVRNDHTVKRSVPMRCPRTGIIGLWLLGAISLSGCGRNASATNPATGHPVIVRLLSQSHVITITCGPQSPLYSVSTTSGQQIVADVTLDQMRQLAPELYERLRPALVSGALANDAPNTLADGPDASLGIRE